MQIYGDSRRKVSPKAELSRLAARLKEAEGMAAGWARHDALTAAFVLASGLAQGLADAEFEAKGLDDVSPVQERAMALLVALARKLRASLASGFREAGPDAERERAALAQTPLPDRIAVATAEGFAFYAVHPEAYLTTAAAIAWDAPPLVIGLRSIGAALAALVAASSPARDALSLRPAGHPFRRELRVSTALRERLARHAGPFAIVDEGPGRSGSSFQAAATLLADFGVADRRIIFLPSHAGEPGPEALPHWRAQWRRARRVPAVLEPEASWFEDLVGPVASMADLSAGAWAAARRDRPPTHPAFERRKLRLVAENGVWLAKFAGLGAIGEQKLARARTLAKAGFAAEPLGLRRGYIVERWAEGTAGPQIARRALIAHLSRYLGLRARDFPAAEDEGADLEQLWRMARANIAELGGNPDVVPDPPSGPGAPVHVDSRLHRWEWLATAEGRLLKTDALDHSCAHDLVGCQDVAWDVAGARVEFGLDESETAQLSAGISRVCGRQVAPDLTEFFGWAYPAFQAGLWKLAGNASQIGRYRTALRLAESRRAVRGPG